MEITYGKAKPATCNTASLYESYFSSVPGIEDAGTVPIVYAEKLAPGEFLQKWVSENKACLVKGAVKHWPAVQQWRNENYWISHCENFDVTIFPHQNYIDAERQQTNHLTLKYHDAIRRLFKKEDAVFSMPGEEITARNRLAVVLKDIRGFTFLPDPPPPRYYEQIRFFSYRNAATAWHFHNADETLMCQVNGVKQVTLFSPDIPRPEYVTDFFLKEKYLHGEKMDPTLDLGIMRVNVEEGDALYIPPYWHHVVVPADSDIGFTLAFCWASPLHILGRFRNYFVRRLYKDAFKSGGPKVLLVPFIALASGCAWMLRRIKKRR
jgi:hypothetical protein